MPSSDKTRENLISSMVKTRDAATAKKAPAGTGAKSAKPAGAGRSAAGRKKPASVKKKTVKKPLPGGKSNPAADAYQSRGRIWPD